MMQRIDYDGFTSIANSALLSRRPYYYFRRIGIVLLLIILVALMGCKKSPRKSAALIGETDLSKSGSALDVVVFQPQWLHQAQFAGFYVAHDKGIYRKYGIDVRIENGGPDRPSPERLESGDIDFTTMFLASALREYNDGSDIVNLAQLSQQSALLWVAKRNHGINKLADLKGKKVGIWYSDFYEPSMVFIRKNKLDVDIVPMGWTVNLFLRNGVDAMNMMLYNEYDLTRNAGMDSSELCVFPLADYGVNIVEDGIYCHREYYQNNPDLCRRFVQASLEGWQYALKHEEESLAIVLHYQREAHLPANIPHQRWMLEKMREIIFTKPEQYGILTEKDFYFSTGLMKEAGLIKKTPVYNDFALNLSAKRR